MMPCSSYQEIYVISQLIQDAEVLCRTRQENGKLLEAALTEEWYLALFNESS
jgi:hypothetical protein